MKSLHYMSAKLPFFCAIWKKSAGISSTSFIKLRAGNDESYMKMIARFLCYT